jgi:hypothetical protein
VNVELQYTTDCPHWRVIEARLSALRPKLGFKFDLRLITTEEEAQLLGFRGSPTILLDGVDPFKTGDEAVGLACRVYNTPTGLAGSPTDEQLFEAISR